VLKPRRDGLRRQFFARLNSHLARAEPGSLAGIMAGTRRSGATAADQQVPQWLFAFDPTGMATFRALALLSTHHGDAERARQEVRARRGAAPDYPFLRACVLDALRLWPTTPMVLRQTTAATDWDGATMPAKTGVLIFANFFHRDDQRLPFANRFKPAIWLERRDNRDWPLIPFSGGPAMCPGRNLVLLLSSAMLAELLGELRLRMNRPARLNPDRPLPGTLDNFSLRFRAQG